MQPDKITDIDGKVKALSSTLLKPQQFTAGAPKAQAILPSHTYSIHGFVLPPNRNIHRIDH